MSRLVSPSSTRCGSVKLLFFVPALRVKPEPQMKEMEHRSGRFFSGSDDITTNKNNSSAEGARIKISGILIVSSFAWSAFFFTACSVVLRVPAGLQPCRRVVHCCLRGSRVQRSRRPTPHRQHTCAFPLLPVHPRIKIAVPLL